MPARASAEHQAADATARPENPANLGRIASGAMADVVLFAAVLALFGLAYWLTASSDDDDQGGGLMQPVLVPVRVHNRR